MNNYNKLNNTWLLLKISYGILFIAAGADKFLNIIVHWQKYVSPFIFEALGITYTPLKIFIAAVEIILGLLVLSKWTKVGAYGIAAWFLIIVVNLLTMWNYFDIVVRDLILAIGAIALAWLTDIKNSIKTQ